jgi:hypothetical protein
MDKIKFQAHLSFKNVLKEKKSMASEVNETSNMACALGRSLLEWLQASQANIRLWWKCQQEEKMI